MLRLFACWICLAKKCLQIQLFAEFAIVACLLTFGVAQIEPNWIGRIQRQTAAVLPRRLLLLLFVESRAQCKNEFQLSASCTCRNRRTFARLRINQCASVLRLAAANLLTMLMNFDSRLIISNLEPRAVCDCVLQLSHLQDSRAQFNSSSNQTFNDSIRNSSQNSKLPLIARYFLVALTLISNLKVKSWKLKFLQTTNKSLTRKRDKSQALREFCCINLIIALRKTRHKRTQIQFELQLLKLTSQRTFADLLRISRCVFVSI